MARMDDLFRFARLHDLKIGTIRDLIAYRRKHDRLVEQRSRTRFTSRWGGEWDAISFYNKATGEEVLAITKGRIDPDRPTLVRMHALAPFSDLLGGSGDRADLLRRSMEIIASEGRGVLVLIVRPMPDFASRQIRELEQRAEGGGMDPELRDYGVGAQILAELGVHDMILLTNTPQSLVALEGYGLSIVGDRAIDS